VTHFCTFFLPFLSLSFPFILLPVLLLFLSPFPPPFRDPLSPSTFFASSPSFLFFPFSSLPPPLPPLLPSLPLFPTSFRFFFFSSPSFSSSSSLFLPLSSSLLPPLPPSFFSFPSSSFFFFLFLPLFSPFRCVGVLWGVERCVFYPVAFPCRSPNNPECSPLLFSLEDQWPYPCMLRFLECVTGGAWPRCWVHCVVDL